MKKAISLLLALLLAGCAAQARSGQEDGHVQLVRQMMALDYETMPLAAFNDALAAMCDRAGTTVFEVLSCTYDHYAVYNRKGVFMYHAFDDEDLEAFVKTTLSYSAQELYGQPAHLGVVKSPDGPQLTYEINCVMPDPAALTVAERDETVNSAHGQIKAYWQGIAPQQPLDQLEQQAAAHLKQISSALTQDAVQIYCLVRCVQRPR